MLLRPTTRSCAEKQVVSQPQWYGSDQIPWDIQYIYNGIFHGIYIYMCTAMYIYIYINIYVQLYVYNMYMYSYMYV